MLLNPVERYMWEKGFMEGFEKGFKEGFEKGFKEGVVKGKLEAARRMLDKGFSLDDVVDVTGLSSNQIRNGE